MISATEALERLQKGNERFVSGGREIKDLTNRERRGEVIDQHEPFAIILGCSDARVPSEIVFDQGLGDLFVIRVAGNIVAPSQIGSIEFAAEQFGTRLVIVMGHSNCGAITATLHELEQPNENRSPNLASIVDRIRPAIEPLTKNAENLGHSSLLLEATRANIHASVNQLCDGSSILKNMVQKDRLQILGAEYSIETGKVKFLQEA